LNVRFPPDGESYRAFRFPWSAHPTDGPAVAVEQGPDDKVKLYASWNGATEVATWEVLKRVLRTMELSTELTLDAPTCLTQAKSSAVCSR
jgi:hypothetical protein